MAGHALTTAADAEGARMIKANVENILTYLTYRVTNAVAGGLNAKIRWVKYSAPRLPESRGIQDSDPLQLQWAGRRASVRLTATHAKHRKSRTLSRCASNTYLLAHPSMTPSSIPTVRRQHGHRRRGSVSRRG